MTTTDDMTTLVDNSANNRGSSEGNYEYWLVCPTAFSAIFQLYLCGHVYCWRKLEFSEKSTICIWFVTRTRDTSYLTTEKPDMYCYPSGSLAFNLFLLHIFFFQFPSVLLQKYELQQFVRNICLHSY
jgi:hypothetical protein